MKFDSVLITRAIEFAQKAHAGRLRKYTSEPEFNHPLSVATIVAERGYDEEMVAAAILHDVIEDAAITEEELVNLFGEEVTRMVVGLSDVSKPEDGNRKIRKEIDRQHIASGDWKIKSIKLADLIDNTKSILQYDPKFSKVYIPEARLLLEVLKEGDKNLWETLNSQINP